MKCLELYETKQNEVGGMVYDVRRSSLEKIADTLFYVVMLLFTIERAFISEGSGAFIQYFILLFTFFALFSWRIYFKKFHVAIIFYILFLVVGTYSDLRTIGGYSNRIIWNLMRAWIGCFLMIPAYNMARRSHSKSLTIIYCLLFFSCATAICQFLGVGTSELGVERGVAGERLATFGANANGTARVVALAVLFAAIVLIGGIKFRNPVNAIICVALSIVCMYAMVKTGSRGGLVACVVAITGLVFTTSNISKKMACIFAGCLLLAILAFVVLNSQNMLDRIGNTIYGEDTGGRNEIRAICRELWGDAKLCGYGCTAHQYIIGDYLTENIFGFKIPDYRKATHNTYYYGFMSGGIIGAAFYYFALGLIAWKSFKMRKYTYGNYLFLVVILMLSSGWVMNIENNKWLFVVYGVVLGMEEKIRMDKKMGLPSILVEVDRPRFAFTNSWNNWS